jgi:hypothetical protein
MNQQDLHVALTLAARWKIPLRVIDVHGLHSAGVVAIVAVDAVVLRRNDAISTVPLARVARVEKIDGRQVWRADNEISPVQQEKSESGRKHT